MNNGCVRNAAVGQKKYSIPNGCIGNAAVGQKKVQHPRRLDKKKVQHPQWLRQKCCRWPKEIQHPQWLRQKYRGWTKKGTAPPMVGQKQGTAPPVVDKKKRTAPPMVASEMLRSTKQRQGCSRVRAYPAGRVGSGRVRVTRPGSESLKFLPDRTRPDPPDP